MKRLVLLVPLVVACVAEDDLSEVESAGTSYQGTSYQGTSYQGTSYQGTSYQGTSYQGTSYQGTSYQGATWGTAAVTGKVTNATLSTWRRIAGANWEQRLPDQICRWNWTKTAATCTTVNLNTTPSPLAGATFQATFHDPTTGTTREGTLRIGSGTGDLGAVRADTSLAMHPLNGTDAPGSVHYGLPCTHPNGCGVNGDLWLFDVELVDTNGVAVNFCKGTERALALPGTWDLSGTRSRFTTRNFTFACTNGTIAKCTRWGYRPFGYATKSNGVSVEMADYHQACIRAAAADYCANGTSFTKDGTLIDIYDYHPHTGTGGGFIPRIHSLFHQDADPPTAFQRESRFDKHGATELDFVRYTELGQLATACPGKFSLGTQPDPDMPHIPASRGPSTFEPPYVSVDATTTCSHDETTLGRWLHPGCSVCTDKLWRMFGDFSCLSSTGSWNATCQKLALDNCTVSERMASHGECTTGGPLRLYDSACTLAVCGDPQYQSCCTSGWTASCVSAANARCTGGREHTNGAITYGFCAVALPIGFGS
jgi:hypothetical protein